MMVLKDQQVGCVLAILELMLDQQVTNILDRLLIRLILYLYPSECSMNFMCPLIVFPVYQRVDDRSLL